MVKQIISAVQAAIKLDRRLHALMPLPGIPHIEVHSTKVPKVGFQASAWRGVARVLGRSATTVHAAKPFGMIPRLHPFNLLPHPDEPRSDKVRFQTSTQRFARTKSRGGRGATTLSQRASKSVRPGTRRRRCRFRNKSGKTCLRPRNHGGRHRFS